MTTTSSKQLTLSALFSAMICLFTAFVCHIPFGVNGTYIHIGDAMIFLGACILPKPYAIAAAAIGAGTADLLTAPVWAPATILIKSLVVLSFTSKKDTIITKQNILAILPAYLISAFGYCIAEVVMFGSWATAVPSVISTTIQIVGSAIIFLLVGTAFDKLNLKNRL